MTKVSMLVPYKGNDEKSVLINPDDFKGVEPVVDAGECYPDLYSQASYQLRNIATNKEHIYSAVKELRFQLGTETVNIILKTIRGSIDREIEFIGSDDLNDEYAKKMLLDLSNEAYHVEIITKALLDVLSHADCIRDIEDEIKLTQKHILL